MGKIKYWGNECMQTAVDTYLRMKISGDSCGDAIQEIDKVDMEAILKKVTDLEVTREHVKIDYYVINFEEKVEFADLRDLEKFPNLSILKIVGQDIENLENMPYLEKLHTLCLTDDKINDISNLKGEKLKVVYLNENCIEDISVLENLKECEILNIAYNNIVDISALENLKFLIRLQLENNKIKNIDALSKLSELCSLDLSNNKIQSIEPLKALVKMLYLYIQNNKIENIDELYLLTELIEFNWQGNEVDKCYEKENIDFYSIQELSGRIDKKRWQLVTNNKEQNVYKEFFENEISNMHPLYKVKIIPIAIYIDKNKKDDENFILAMLSKERMVIINMAHCLAVDGEDVGYPSYRMFLKLDEAIEYLKDEDYCI